MKKILLYLLTLATLLVVLPNSIAATLNPTNPATSVMFPLQVTATIASTCVINTNDINFGSLNLNQKYNSITGDFVVRCSNNLPYQITFNQGLRGNRTMIGTLTQSTLNYTLCTQAGYSNGQCVNNNILNGVGTGIDQNNSIYGYIDTSGDYPSNDTYSDTVVATITY
jgi:spore coat protein U-like protein